MIENIKLKKGVEGTALPHKGYLPYEETDYRQLYR